MEVSDRLDTAAGYRPLPSIVCRFFQRHSVTRKKDGACRRARECRYSPAPHRLVRRSTRSRSRAPGLHRRMRHFDQDGPPVWSCRPRRALPGSRAAWPLEDHDLRRCTASVRRDGTHDPGRCHDGGRLPGLCRAGSGPDLAARRHRGDGQLASPQAAGNPQGDRTRRRRAPIPAALQPRLTPIEMAFSKIKALLKKAAARTVIALWDAVRDAIDAVTSTDCLPTFEIGMMVVSRVVVVIL